MQKLNYYFLMVFAPVLVVTGVMGLLGPSPFDLMSVQVPYDIMHICAGSLGILLVATKRVPLIRGFNVGFGAFDLYQFVASMAGLFPIEHFQWRAGDDVLHVVLGLALVLVGLFGR